MIDKDNTINEDNTDKDLLDFIHTNENTDNKNKINDTDTFDTKYIYGIDLGTTNSCISVWRNDNIEIIPDEYGNKTIPSMVAYTNMSQYVGYDAKNQKDINSENVFYEVKRLIGRKITDEQVNNEKELLSYSITHDDKDGILLESSLIGDRKFTPEEISANILMKLKSIAKRYMNTDDVKDVVITIPANFNDGQRQATKDAAVIAGLNPIMLINEPTAAALAYGMANRSKIIDKVNLNTDNCESDYLTLLVYDFGGGTLDVSLLTVYDGIFEVRASSGNTHFGGSDFDERIMAFCLNKFKRHNNYDKINISCVSLQKLRKECENIKKILSTSSKANIAVKDFYDEKNLFVSLTRSKFEEICSDLFMMCLAPVDDILDITDTHIDEVDEIILVGGMTKVPYIKKLIKNKFGKDGNFSINPNEAISTGAAIRGYMIANRDDPFTNNIGLIDVTSLSLGVETIGDVMDVIVPRKSMLPCEKSKIFTTDTDNVDSVTIKIYEGERSMTCNNFFVGEFELGNIPLAPRGYPQIEVKFKIDTNGIINVTAKNLDTEESNSITVSGNKGRLTKNEIEDLVERCKEQEYLDNIEKMKKLYHYELYDLQCTIVENINNHEFKLNSNDKNVILSNMEKLLKWINDKKYTDRELEEFEEKVKEIKEKYGTLILKGNLKDSKFTANNEDSKNMQKTTVYGNESDDEEEINMTFEKIEDEELGTYGMTDVEKDEIKELRNNLFSLCESVYDVINSKNLNIDTEHRTELCEFINDTLLWLHAREKPAKIEYKMKIDEIDKACNKLMEHYESSGGIFKKNSITENNENIISELENLCMTLNIMIEQKSLPLDLTDENNKKDLNMLINKITENIDWIFNNVHNVQNLNKDDILDIDVVKEQCKIKLDELNSMCKNIYNRNICGINVNKEQSFDNNQNMCNKNNQSNKEKEDNTNELGGTSIMDIIKTRQRDAMND
jgi:heat shock 70kDa protein 1/2/6/8